MVRSTQMRETGSTNNSQKKEIGRNANGNLRRTKVLLDLRKIDDHIEYEIDYSK